MGEIWSFQTKRGIVKVGNKYRKQLTADGCNEPFKDRYYCPKKKWFFKTVCPFVNKRECENYADMCGGYLGWW